MDHQRIPSFQSFLKQAKPLSDAERPLPPIPIVKRRASSSSAPRSKTPPSLQSRRSSSVYSQWGKDDLSWHSSDFADQPPVPPLPMLQPLAYSVSTPHLLQKQPTPPLLQPRTYSPLIASPSPSIGGPATPSPLAPNDDQKDYVSAQPKPRPADGRVMKIIPLETALLAAHAPGAIPLLPEEHRAQKMNRSRSQDTVNIAKFGILSSTSPPKLPEPLVLIDNQGRPRSVIPPRGDTSGVKVRSPVLETGSNLYGEWSDLPNSPRPGTATEDWAIFRNTPPLPSELHDSEEPRGRTMQRGPRKIREENPRAMDPPLRTRPDAQAMANEYHALLSRQHGTSSNSLRLHNADSADSLRSKMKMVPSPLFQTPPPVKSTKDASHFNDKPSISPYNLSNYSGSPANSPPSSGPVEYFPGPYSPPTERRHKRMSTSGSIPISPPTATNTGFPSSHATPAPSVTSPTSATSKSARYNKRASAYYPHVASRKTRAKNKTQNRIGTGKVSSSNHDVPTTPSTFLKIRPASDTLGEVRRRSSASSNKSRQPLMQRLARGAAKYADLLTRPDVPERSDYGTITAVTISPGSPHLTRASVSTTPKAVHLGWSETAKAMFDKSVSPAFLSSKPVLYTHVTTPARPLDESKGGLKDAEPRRRKSSIFANFLDSWKDSKAEKRRQDLKKTIMVFPNTDGSVSGGLRRSSGFGWM